MTTLIALFESLKLVQYGGEVSAGSVAAINYYACRPGE